MTSHPSCQNLSLLPKRQQIHALRPLQNLRLECYSFQELKGYFFEQHPRPEVLCRGALETVFSDVLLGRFLVDVDFVFVGVAASSTEVSDSSMMFESEL